MHVVDIRYNIVKQSIGSIPNNPYLYLIQCSCQVQPSTSRAADRCSGQSFVRTGCVVNSPVNGLEQGTAAYFLGDAMLKLVNESLNLFVLSISMNMHGYCFSLLPSSLLFLLHTSVER